MKSAGALFSIIFWALFCVISLLPSLDILPLQFADPSDIWVLRLIGVGFCLIVVSLIYSILRDWNRPAIDDPKPELVFALSPSEKILRLVGSVMIGAGMALTFWGKGELPIFVFMLALVAISAPIVYMVATLFVSSARLTLTPFGLDYSPVKGGPFAWRDVVEIAHWVMGPTGKAKDAIKITFGNVDLYTARGFRPLWWQNLFGNKNKASFSISAYRVGATSAMVKHAIEIRRRAFGQAIAGSRQLPSRPSSIVERH